MHTNQIIHISFTYISGNILTPFTSANVTDSESSLRVVLACLVSEQWCDEDELFNSPLKHVCTHIKL